jgi:transcriptional regulator with XRE-family HTH domain
MKEVSELAIYRRKRNLSQEELAARTGIKRATIGSIESKNQKSIPLDKAVVIAEELGIEDVKTLKRVFLT